MKENSQNTVLVHIVLVSKCYKEKMLDKKQKASLSFKNLKICDLIINIPSSFFYRDPYFWPTSKKDPLMFVIMNWRIKVSVSTLRSKVIRLEFFYRKGKLLYFCRIWVSFFLCMFQKGGLCWLNLGGLQKQLTVHIERI